MHSTLAVRRCVSLKSMLTLTRVLALWNGTENAPHTVRSSEKNVVEKHRNREKIGRTHATETRKCNGITSMRRENMVKDSRTNPYESDYERGQVSLHDTPVGTSLNKRPRQTLSTGSQADASLVTTWLVHLCLHFYESTRGYHGWGSNAIKATETQVLAPIMILTIPACRMIIVPPQGRMDCFENSKKSKSIFINQAIVITFQGHSVVVL